MNNDIMNNNNTNTTSDNMQKHTNTVTTNSSNNSSQSQIISSHYSKDRMAMNPQNEEEKKSFSHSNHSGYNGMMMKDIDLNNGQSAPLSNDSFGDGVDIDLKGIPSFILDLQQIQPTLNIMTCGDVSHGKSTLLAALSGEKTGKHSAEKKGNMTIRLGYTSCKIWKCLICPRPQCYFSTHSDLSIKKVICPHCSRKPNKTHNKYNNGNSDIILIRHLSFVDVPGHAQLMQTMVSATSVADAAILVIDASKPVPGKQTAQHLDAINLLGLMKENQMIIAQNKIDLINHNKACLSYEEIRDYLSTFGNDKLTYNTPIIPISAQSKLNIDALCDSIINRLPKFSKKLLNDKDPWSEQSLLDRDLFLNVIRSFDVNKAKDLRSIQDIDKMTGGILGGSILNGNISIGQIIEIRPGYIIKKQLKKYKSKIDNKLQCQWQAQPIRTRVKSLKYGRNKACYGYPGGNVGIETNIDPSLTKSDRMCGHIIIDANSTNPPPPIFNKFIMSYTFLCEQKAFGKFEQIRVNIGSFKMKAEIIKRDLEQYQGILCVLEAPICAKIGDKVGICRQNKNKEWSFVGGGIIRKTKNIQIRSDIEKQEKLNKKNKNKTEKEEKKNDDNYNDNDNDKFCAKKPKINGKIAKNKNSKKKRNEIKNGKHLSVDIGISSVNVLNDKNKESVHLNYQQRNGRKGVTTIVGLPQKINFKKLSKRMKKKWNTGATIVEDAEKGTIIQIQGDLRREIPAFIVSQNIVEKSQITIHGY